MFRFQVKSVKYAQVVKLVYTRDLKSLASNGMRVRFPPRAPERKSILELVR